MTWPCPPPQDLRLLLFTSLFCFLSSKAKQQWLYPCIENKLSTCFFCEAGLLFILVFSTDRSSFYLPFNLLLKHFLLMGAFQD